MKCASCDDKAIFEIKKLCKNDTLYFCDLHFWQFCGKIVFGTLHSFNKLNTRLKNATNHKKQ